VNKNNLNERYEMEETRERIKLLIKNLGLPTTAKFCRDTGLSRPLVDKLTSPEGNQPRFDTLQKIKSAFPETNLNWLVSGQGEALESVPDKKDVDLLNSYRNIKIKNNSNLTNSFLTSIQFISKEYQEMEEMELNAKAQFILEKELNQFRRELLFYQYQRRLVSERLNKTSDQKSILTEIYNEKRKVELNRLLEELSQQISKTINLITEDVVNITEEKTQIDSSEIYYDEDLKVKE
jgi:transcriptional regulator with XRE-family HTH domain|tara:strand:- start:20 stop:727 length:708 start_codon:yes stop_codon:yes gene_type:complete